MREINCEKGKQPFWIWYKIYFLISIRELNPFRVINGHERKLKVKRQDKLDIAQKACSYYLHTVTVLILILVLSSGTPALFIAIA